VAAPLAQAGGRGLGRTLAVALAWFVTLAAGWGTEPALATRVIVLANAADPDSLRIARHYAAVRGVPAENVIALALARDEEISWREFVATLWRPLLEQLVAAHWIDATPMALTDPVGRRKYAPRGHRIAALVVCRGVPLKIASDPALLTDVPPLTSRREFRTNAGAVDSELALLAQPNYPVTALISSPLYQNERPSPFDLGQVVKVSRLDGPTADAALGLVDRAVAAERTGLLGRAYVDLGHREPTGTAWLESVAEQLGRLSFDVQVDRAEPTMPVASRFDSPVLYFGWYASELNGPFTVPGFQFPPGAIAFHVHSFSAASLRAESRGWTAGFVARGVTATVGNVYEPYLQFTHRPDLFIRALARGDTLVDAAYYSLPALSWQALLIGDPLYRPFAVSLEQQREQGDGLPPALAAYSVLRHVTQLDAAGRRDEATAVAVTALRAAPGLALGASVARRHLERGDRAAAAAALAWVAQRDHVDASDWGLVAEIALLLETCARPDAACAVWRTLLAGASVPREVRAQWLPDAIRVAEASGEAALARTWRDELTRLAPLSQKNKADRSPP